MYATGVYGMNEPLLMALHESYQSLTSEQVVVESLVAPLYYLYGDYVQGKVPYYIAREQFEQMLAILQEEFWYVEEGYGWDAFLQGDLPDFGSEVDGVAAGWQLFTDSLDGMGDYEEGDEVNPMQLVRRSTATFIALYYWHYDGYLYILRSSNVVGGTQLPKTEFGTEDMEDLPLADPLRPNGGVPTYALDSDIIEAAYAYEREQA